MGVDVSSSHYIREQEDGRVEVSRKILQHVTHQQHTATAESRPDRLWNVSEQKLYTYKCGLCETFSQLEWMCVSRCHRWGDSTNAYKAEERVEHEWETVWLPSQIISWTSLMPREVYQIFSLKSLPPRCLTTLSLSCHHPLSLHSAVLSAQPTSGSGLLLCPHAELICSADLHHWGRPCL